MFSISQSTRTPRGFCKGCTGGQSKVIVARAVDSTGTDEESPHSALRRGCQDESVAGAIGCAVRIGHADVAGFAVVERVSLRYVSAELAVINKVFSAAEMELYGIARNSNRYDT